MGKEKKFEKVVEWDKFEKGNGNDKDILQMSAICMIPIIGQLMWLLMLFSSLKYRKVYWREIK